jgi:hypothetical protein
MGRRLIRRGLLVVPATTLALATGIACAQAASTPGWRTVATISQPSKLTELVGVSAAGPAAAWTVGLAESGNGKTIVPLVESWNGTKWTQVGLSTTVISKLGSDPLLDTVAASSPDNIWAFSFVGGWLHGSGTTWTAGKLASTAVLVQSSLAIGDSAWAFGGTVSSAGFKPYAGYYTPKGWTRTTVPAKGTISAASAVSSTDIWAVLGAGELGLGQKSGGLIHWYAGRWHAVRGLPSALDNSSLDSVRAVSDDNVWVGGAVKNSKKGTTEALGHWNGKKWTVTDLHATASAFKYSVVSIVPDGSGGLWALGSCIAGKCPDTSGASRLWHETGGKWSGPVQPKLSKSETALTGLAATGKSVWASGAVKVGKSSGNGLIALWGPTPH